LATFATLQIPVLSPKLIAASALFFMKKFPRPAENIRQIPPELSDK
jgi:hypothetical protein